MSYKVYLQSLVEQFPVSPHHHHFHHLPVHPEDVGAFDGDERRLLMRKLPPLLLLVEK